MNEKTKDYMHNKNPELRTFPSDKEISEYKKQFYRKWAKVAVPGFIIAIIAVIVIYKILGIF